MNDKRRTAKHEEARNTLPDDLKPVFDELVEDYKFATVKAPPNNEGYDLICIHPDPRHRPRRGEVAQVWVQVKRAIEF